ncbi:ABC transporter ATP-binding protein [bacterium 210820-DFI.6.37]|nr:ABC transporter ATP-binding protein [bacterium 210820-DFI.6.37]
MVEQWKLKVEHIYRSYENCEARVEVLNDFNMEVSYGESVAIVGPSGCGKSTFLRLVAGLDKPERGRILYDGIEINETDPNRGFVFQEPNLFPWLTVKDNVGFGLKARKVFKEKKRKIQEYIDLVGLSGFEEAFPYQLSGGMASRASLARTFIQEPGVILLDEPLSALDAFTKESIQNEILKIWKKNKPIIILVTHDIEEAVYLSDRILVMSDRPGKIIGQVMVGIDHPRDRTSTEFVAKRKEILEILKNKNE